ncbi:MAG: hypothetical protein ABIG44_16375 [Planctomycetota bacterium]
MNQSAWREVDARSRTWVWWIIGILLAAELSLFYVFTHVTTFMLLVLTLWGVLLWCWNRYRMPRPSRRRRVLKWIGTSVCMVLMILLIMQIWICGTWSEGNSLIVSFGNGGVGIALFRTNMLAGSYPAGWRTTRHQPLSGWLWGCLQPPATIRVTRQWANTGVMLVPSMLFVGSLTVLLWWRERHVVLPGHCRKCGYNLTGNVSGVCPECGTPVHLGNGEDIL